MVAFILPASDLCSEEWRKDKAEYSKASVSPLCTIFLPEINASDLHLGCLRKVNGGIFHFYYKEMSWIFFLLETVNDAYFVILKIKSLKFQILIAVMEQPQTPEV